MGQKQEQSVKQLSIEDNIIQMRLQSKSIQRAGKKAEKEAALYQKKAKDALKKNEQQLAKLYLATAASKKREGLNCQRTALKMEFMCGQIKSVHNNQQIMNTFGALSQAVAQQSAQLNPTQMMEQMQQLNTKMDEMMIYHKMTEEIMNTEEIGTSQVAEQMKQALMQEIAMEQHQALMEDQVKKNAIKQKQSNEEFLNQLKGL